MKLFVLAVLLLMILTACDLVGGLASLSEKEVTLPAFSGEEEAESITSSEGSSEAVSSITDASSSEFEAPDQTASETDLQLLGLTETVKRGETATVTIRGIPGQTYVITVHYPSSVSTASGLEPKAAGDNGEVTWSWRVGSRTTVGTHRIVIEGAGETLTLTFTVTS